MQRMKLAYGYNRREQDFAHIEPDKLWLDMPGTNRQEQGDMFRDGAIHEGDEVHVVSEGDLRPASLKNIIRERGATLHVSPPPRESRPPGAPAKFNPTPEQSEQIRTLWLNPGYTLRYVLTRAAEILGHDVKRHQLIYRYGPRHKRSTEQS